MVRELGLTPMVDDTGVEIAGFFKFIFSSQLILMQIDN
jgi:hypothetical protein